MQLTKCRGCNEPVFYDATPEDALYLTSVMSAYSSLIGLQLTARPVSLAVCLIQQRRRDAVLNCWIANEEKQAWRR